MISDATANRIGLDTAPGLAFQRGVHDTLVAVSVLAMGVAISLNRSILSRMHLVH